MSLPKLTVIGAGNVGATLAQRLLEKDLGNVVMLDVAEGTARGKALDLNQAGAVEGYAARVRGTADYADTAGSRVIVVTSGSARKPGMSRDDLLKINAAIVRSVVEKAAPLSPDAVLIIVTNPLDAMVHAALKASGWPRERVLGMAGVLDSARYCEFLAEALGVSARSVSAMVLGGHGDEMVPCRAATRVAGMPLEKMLPEEKWQAVVARTRQGGAEIVKYLQTGSAYYAPSASAARMAEAVLKNEQAVLPCAVRLDGEYGYRGQVLGVPAVLGAGGLVRVIELDLAADEREALARSAQAVRALCEQIDRDWDTSRS